MDLNASKILLLSALTNQSGSGVRFWNIGKELAQHKHCALLLERSVAKNRKGEDSNLHSRSIHDTGLLWLDILRATWFNVFHGLRFRPDWVYALKPLPNSCLPALLLKHIYNCRIILDIDDLDFEYYSDGFTRRMVRASFEVFTPHFDLITTHNPHLRSFIVNEIGISPTKIHFLAQGTEAGKFIAAAPANGYRRRWGLNADDKVVIYCASLGITSDFQYILPMLISFLRKCEDTKILVIGDGTRRGEFSRDVETHGLQERLIFTGYLPHSDMAGVLKLARVGINYMAPTRANECRASIKVREYLAAGLNVVCNPIGDAEIFNDYVILCSRIEDFPEGIRKAFQGKNEARIRAAQQFVEKNYSWRPIIRDFLAYLTDFSKSVD
jgi:glycosyltransferase involved in cell wall biosynthesis